MPRKRFFRQFEAAGASGVIIKADLSLVSEINHLVEQTLTAFGRIDIPVNNAGIEERNDYWQVSESEYDAVMNINLKGVSSLHSKLFVTFKRRNVPGKSSTSAPCTRNYHSRISLPTA
jgi:NAD(P)-dependent dehydrogenase (short-subunit alcohol dehydrogenase family)